MEHPKWYIKSYHLFLVYLPVILLTLLILTIYTTYIFTYLNILINTPNDLPEIDFIFMHTLNPIGASTKGATLLIITSVLVFMLFLCMYRTVFMNPGHFPSPLDLEFKILNKNSIEHKLEDEEDQLTNSNDKFNFLTNINKILVNGPMTTVEGNELKDKVSNYFHYNNLNKKDHKFVSNEEILNNNKKNYMENYDLETTTSSCCVEKPQDKIFLSIYSGIDLYKTNLCGSCLRMKVERSHHCRQCGRCVLKMDHHCPWLSNCIGFRNYKSFCLLHFYGALATLLITLTYWEVIVNFNLNFDYNLITCWLVCFVYTCNFGLMVFLFWLFYVNTNLLLAGQTIIEQADRERFPSSKGNNIYDLGWKRNFSNVFGSNPLVWFIPFFANYKGNGLIFETNGFYLD